MCVPLLSKYGGAVISGSAFELLISPAVDTPFATVAYQLEESAIFN